MAARFSSCKITRESVPREARARPVLQADVSSDATTLAVRRAVAVLAGIA